MVTNSLFLTMQNKIVSYYYLPSPYRHHSCDTIKLTIFVNVKNEGTTFDLISCLETLRKRGLEHAVYGQAFLAQVLAQAEALRNALRLGP